MVTVQIEHPIRDYQAWKAAFDADPAQRQASGVFRYRVSRPVDDQLYVIIELDFAARVMAETFLAKMRAIWKQVDGTIVVGPKARMFECVEDHEY
jgi:hypothetical protein